MNVKLVAMTPDPLMVIERAACQCYQSEPTPDGKIAKACYKSGHHSVLEHAFFTFEIGGISRACLAQLTRHRLASFSVKSQRYVNEDDFSYVVPQVAANDPDALDDFIATTEEIRDAYERFQQKYHWKNEDARMVLPNACCTSLTMSMNLRELIHFCNERMCTRAQSEIRDLAYFMAEEVNSATNNAFKDWLVPKCMRYKPYNFCTERDCCGKSPRLKDVYKKEAK